MPRIKETTVYQYDELSEKAQGKARDWYRHASAGDNFFAEHIIDELKSEIGPMLGWDISNVYWSGFSSQGDGACFEGSWSAGKVASGLKLVDYAPQDTELHRIAAEYKKLTVQAPGASAGVKHRGHYSHEHCTEFDIYALDADGEDIQDIAEFEDALKEVSRDLMRWVYQSLEKEYEYQTADEQVADTIRANEYEFTEDGERE